jgi:hypothetical protein
VLSSGTAYRATEVARCAVPPHPPELSSRYKTLPRTCVTQPNLDSRLVHQPPLNEALGLWVLPACILSLTDTVPFLSVSQPPAPFPALVRRVRNWAGAEVRRKPRPRKTWHCSSGGKGKRGRQEKDREMRGGPGPRGRAPRHKIRSASRSRGAPARCGPSPGEAEAALRCSPGCQH